MTRRAYKDMDREERLIEWGKRHPQGWQIPETRRALRMSETALRQTIASLRGKGLVLPNVRVGSRSLYFLGTDDLELLRAWEARSYTETARRLQLLEAQAGAGTRVVGATDVARRYQERIRSSAAAASEQLAMFGEQQSGSAS